MVPRVPRTTANSPPSITVSTGHLPSQILKNPSDVARICHAPGLQIISHQPSALPKSADLSTSEDAIGFILLQRLIIRSFVSKLAEMDMSGMSGMGGMDMGSNGPFKGTNMSIARIFWYLVAAFCALRGLERIGSTIRTKYAKRKHSIRSAVPSRPSNIFSQAHDTLSAVCREMTYPQLAPLKGSVSRYFSPPPLGNCLILAAYWTVILAMLWTNTILTPSSSLYAYKWEIVGFRAAWVSVTQLPLIFCLSGKFNIISIITGVSYERLNWLHRWVSRTLFLTVIVHWSFFFREWTIANFVSFELAMMPMVKYGFGAWAVLGWTVITSFGYFRAKAYEIWILQHIASAGVLLWLLYVHVPSYARYNIWLSIGFVAFDRGVRFLSFVINNVHIRGLWAKTRSGPWYGFEATAESLPHGYVHLTVKDIKLKWSPGQHLFISIPTCGPFESHPFTIATGTQQNGSLPGSVEFYFKCHSGFTKRLLRQAQPTGAINVRALLSRPFGIPPLSTLERSNTVVLVASSTGGSFTVPILEHAIRNGPFIQRINFVWITRHPTQLQWFQDRITAAAHWAKASNIDFSCQIFVTGISDEVAPIEDDVLSRSTSLRSSHLKGSVRSSEEDESSSGCSADSLMPEKACQVSESTGKGDHQKESTQQLLSDILSPINVQYGRPRSWDELIYPSIIEAEGETVIIACGGNRLISQIRNYTAALSDERAVHKGTSAQGIFLFTETYNW